VGPLFHELLKEVVDVTDLRVVDAHLQLAPNCILHRAEIRVFEGDEIRSYMTQHLDSLTGMMSVNADVRVNFMECRPTLLEMVNFCSPFIKCQYFNDGSTDFH